MAFIKNTKWPIFFYYSLNIKKRFISNLQLATTCTWSHQWVTGPQTVSDAVQVPVDSENSIFLK